MTAPDLLGALVRAARIALRAGAEERATELALRIGRLVRDDDELRLEHEVLW